MTVIDNFIKKIEDTLKNEDFVKFSMGNYKGSEPKLKNIYIKPVEIKNKKFLAFNYHYQTRDIHKNYPFSEALSLIQNYLEDGFKIATLFTTKTELIIESNKKEEFKIREKQLQQSLKVDLSHDKQKQRVAPPTAPYLQKLGLTDEKGIVFKNSQDKYRQINKYIEILNGLISELGNQPLKRIVDMGSGKGYLTFALYDFLQSQNRSIEMTGVEYRQDMVNLCNNLAKDLDFKELHFEQGTIENYASKQIDLLIALHACDTATDEAIAKGIQANASLIVVAPCCHKQIRREIEKSKIANDLNFITKHGIFLERQAEMVTDALRALMLEYFGYRTKVFQFVSDVHTPKNVMVVGIKTQERSAVEKENILQKIRDTKAYFGISYHQLEKLTELSL